MSTPQDVRNRIIPFDSLIGTNLDGVTFRYINRESNETQELHHDAKFEALREAHVSLGIAASFDKERHTGSGSLKILYDFFDFHLLDMARLLGTYWKFLEEEIRKGLDKTAPGKKLYIVFCTLSRLMRPAKFHQNDVRTWDYTERDYEIFNRWLIHCFGERAKDIIFVMLRLGTPREDRGYETFLGMHYSGNLGGRPRKFDFGTPKGRRQFKKLLEQEAIELRRSCGMNGSEILRHFERTWQGEAAKYLAKKRTIQDWLNKARCPANPGRPKGKRNRCL